MKKLMSFVIIVLLTVIVGCGLITPRDEFFGELRLVPLSTNDLTKAITDENGQMWLPKSELSAVLAKSTVFDINFDEVLATKTLQYVIMNIGDQDVFDVNINARDLYIYPKTIGLIQAFGQDIGLSALPIVNVIKKHVIPVDNVGVFLEMEIGDFVDTLALNYSYTLGGDTVGVADDYSVGGTKMGVALDFFCEDSSFSLMDYFYSVFEGESNKSEVRFKTFSSMYFDKLSVINNGNVAIGAYSYSSTGLFIDLQTDSSVTMNPGDTLNVGSMFAIVHTILDTTEYSGVYNYLEFGPTQNIIKSLDGYFFNGHLVTRAFIKY